jgi:hypothetical protein
MDKAAGFGISLLLSLVVAAVYVLAQPEFHLIRSAGLLDVIEAKTLDLRFRYSRLYQNLGAHGF